MLKLKSQILVVDPRFFGLEDKHVEGKRASVVEEHYDQVEAIALAGPAPLDVKVAFDRARNIFIYAWYCYELLVVCETQAFAALELALRTRLDGLQLNKNGGLDHLFKQAILVGVLPAIDNRRVAKLIALRNKLAHGDLEIHTPKMALQLLLQCATIIDQLLEPGKSD